MNFHFTSLVPYDNYSNFRTLLPDDRLQSQLTNVFDWTIATSLADLQNFCSASFYEFSVL